jgi:hypothetical protein
MKPGSVRRLFLLDYVTSMSYEPAFSNSASIERSGSQGLQRPRTRPARHLFEQGGPSFPCAPISE